MGLLDNIGGLLGTSMEDPRTMATLQMAQGLLGGGGSMQRLAGGLQGYGGVMAQARQLEEQRKAEALKRQLLEAQIGETKAQAQQRQAEALRAQQQAAEQRRIQSLLDGAVQSVKPGDAITASGVRGPRPEALSAIGQQAPIDYRALIAAGVPIDRVKALAESQDYGRPKVARTVKGIGPDGKEYEYQVDDFGRTVGNGLAQYRAPIQADTGGAVNFLDPYNLGSIAKMGKTNSPDALLSAGTARRGQDMTDARSREKNQIDAAGAGKYEYKQDAQGNWMALPKEVTPNGQPIQPIPVTAPNKNTEGAKRAIAIIDAAGPLIDKATSSYIGAGADQAARVFGAATPGAVAGSQLKALEGALMMAQPRMEGPQSDKDTALYRQMAAQIGDSTVPAAQKKAALAVIRQLHTQYTGGAPQPASGPSLEDLLKKY